MHRNGCASGCKSGRDGRSSTGGSALTEEGNTRRKRRTDEPDPKDRAREQGGLAGGRQEPRSFEPNEEATRS